MPTDRLDWLGETAKRKVISHGADAFFDRFWPDAPRKRTSPAANPLNDERFTVPVRAATLFLYEVVTREPAIVCVSVKLRTGIVTSTPLTFPSLSTSIAPLKSGASFGTFATVLSDWLRCIVPPPVSKAKDEVSSSVSGLSGVSPSSAS